MNPTSPRLRRSRPERIGPDRGALGLSHQSQAPGTPQSVVSAAGAAVCGMVEGGVRTAYSVIDEYLRRGQAAARGLFNDPNKRGPMSEAKGNCGSYTYPPWPGYGQGGGYYAPLNPMAMMMDQWLAAMRAWTGFWFACIPPPLQQCPPYPCCPQGSHDTAPGSTPPCGPQQSPQRRAVAEPRASADGRLESITVTTSSRGCLVECTANLSAGVYSQGLVCDPLHPKDFRAPDIAPEPLDYGPGTLKVTVKVPAGQPEGRYSGLIRRKPDQCPVGEVTLVISAASA